MRNNEDILVLTTIYNSVHRSRLLMTLNKAQYVIISDSDYILNANVTFSFTVAAFYVKFFLASTTQGVAYAIR